MMEENLWNILKGVTTKWLNLPSVQKISVFYAASIQKNHQQRKQGLNKEPQTIYQPPKEFLQQKVLHMYLIPIIFIANPELIRANNAKMVFQNRLPLPLRDKKPGEPQPEKEAEQNAAKLSLKLLEV